MQPPRPDTQAIGRAAEEIAAAFYAKAGFRLVIRNFRTRQSEIDLVLARGRLLLFVEVKGRAGDWQPHAWKMNWRGKCRKLHTGMRQYLQRHPESFDLADEFCGEIVFVTQGRVSARFREW